MDAAEIGKDKFHQRSLHNLLSFIRWTSPVSTSDTLLYNPMFAGNGIKIFTGELTLDDYITTIKLTSV